MNHSSLPLAPVTQDTLPAGTRGAPRFAVNLPLVLHDDEGTAYRVEVVNLSTGGLQLRCDAATALRLNRPHAPQVFSAALPPDEAAARQSLLGLRKHYLQLDPDTGCGLMGCDFVGLRPVAARRLRALVLGAQPEDSGVEVGDQGAANARDLVFQ